MHNFEKFGKFKIIDSHVHFQYPENVDFQVKVMDGSGIERFGIVCMPSEQVNHNPQGIYFKSQHPDRVFLFGCLDYSARNPSVEKKLTLAPDEQVDRLMNIGCDGFKMVEGKPSVYRGLGMKFTDPFFQPFFAKLEKDGIPLIWHIADPEEFWDPQRIPPWAAIHNWGYDALFPSQEALLGEAEEILRRHPALKAIFAHFYFMSADLDRAGRLLDSYRNVCLDLTPGVEMYHSFTANRQRAKEFFITYQDRIIFGTDSGLEKPGGGDMDVALGRVWMVRNFLETEEVFAVPYDPLMTPDPRPPLHGLALPQGVCKKIYCANFERVAGQWPKRLDRGLAGKELERLAAIVKSRGVTDRENIPLQMRKLV